MVEFGAMKLMLRGGAVVVYWDNIYHSSTNHFVQILYKNKIVVLANYLVTTLSQCISSHHMNSIRHCIHKSMRKGTLQ